MLQADKNALAQALRVQMLSLQWRELEYLHTNFLNLATSSALLTGFGFAAVSMTSDFHPEHRTRDQTIWELSLSEWLDYAFIQEMISTTIFWAAGALALAMNLLSLFISTVSIMCGPGMALRGPEGSVVVAVRHLELQLKRALRFFGRGLVAFTVSIMAIGLRRLNGVGFAGGGASILIGLWTVQQLGEYGADIAEKFYISPDRAVRGMFVDHGDGQVHWQNTADERAQTRVVAGWYCFGREFGRRVRRWRPKGHGWATPILRLDKVIAFPYLASEGRVRALSESGNDAVRERALLQKLVMSAQGPIGSSSSAHVGGGIAGAAEQFDPSDLLDSILGAANGMLGGAEPAPSPALGSSHAQLHQRRVGSSDVPHAVEMPNIEVLRSGKARGGYHRG
jgi:hypothetical protein